MSQRFGKYTLLRPLGEGGMAEVFLAHDTSPSGLDRLVVVKRILPHLSQLGDFVSMFLNESRISIGLNHPNIAHVHEVGEIAGRSFLSMEFVHGADLRDILRCRSPRLSTGMVALIGNRIAAALHHAHKLTNLKGEALGVIHRDVSPQNIRISHEGTPYVLDFGIVKAASNHKTTKQGVLKGKYPYMSPEQIRGEPLDGRSDVFSLGVVMHEMLTYRRLFGHRRTKEILEAIMYRPIPRPSEFGARSVRPELEAVVMRALEQDRDRRYPDARALQRDLDRYLGMDPAAGADLEELMTELFGEAAERRARLLSGLPLPEVGSGPTQAPEPADTVLAIPKPKEEAVSSTEKRPASSRRRPRLIAAIALGACVIIAAGICVATLGLDLDLGGDAPKRRAVVVAEAPTPDFSTPRQRAPAPDLGAASAPAPAPPPISRRVRIVSVPAGAAVYNARRRLGKLPLSLPWAEKTYYVTVKHRGYRTRRVPVKPDQERIIVRLRRRTKRSAPRRRDDDLKRLEVDLADPFK